MERTTASAVRRACSTCQQPVAGGSYHGLCRPRIIYELGRVPPDYESWWVEQFRRLPTLLPDAEGDRQVRAIVRAAHETRARIPIRNEGRPVPRGRRSIRLRIADSQYVVRWIGRNPYLYRRTYVGVVRHSRPRQHDEYVGRLDLQDATLGAEAVRTAIAEGRFLKPIPRRASVPR